MVLRKAFLSWLLQNERAQPTQPKRVYHLLLAHRSGRLYAPVRSYDRTCASPSALLPHPRSVLTPRLQMIPSLPLEIKRGRLPRGTMPPADEVLARVCGARLGIGGPRWTWCVWRGVLVGSEEAGS